jgi:p-aminobenzoyl-glutamate transporter AbgT
MAATVQFTSCVVIESSFDPGERLKAPGSLWLTNSPVFNGLFKYFFMFFLILGPCF